MHYFCIKPIHLALTTAVLTFLIASTFAHSRLLAESNGGPDVRILNHKDDPVWLDGNEKTFLINGYSTSYAWPAMLQEMLDEHSGGQRVYHVANAVVGGSPVETWIADPDTANYRRTMEPMLRDFFGDAPRLLGDAPPPTIALCQQSLQFTLDRRGPVKRIDDPEGIRIGADALEKLAMRLKEHGLKHVIIGMHIYKKPVEPEVGNERFALKALLDRNHPFIHEGPDTWSLTINRFPECFDEDELHPNQLGKKIMAEAWYRCLAGKDARQEIIDRMHAKEYDVNAMMRDYIRWRRGGTSDHPAE